MKDETASIAFENFVTLSSKMYSCFLYVNSEHEKAKGLNRNTVATVSYKTMNA